MFSQYFKDECGILGQDYKGKIKNSDKLSPCFKYYLVIMLLICNWQESIMNNELKYCFKVRIKLSEYSFYGLTIKKRLNTFLRLFAYSHYTLILFLNLLS